ncbi:MAG: exo-alpha-sialidase [Clostridia bacterium]|nr:exo-alpha-sialidase [Clostridia bacterium]
MKKALSIVLAVIMLFSLSTIAFAADYTPPFEKGTKDSDAFRIPAIYTLNNGSVIAAADMRYGHGSDSPNNIDSLIAISANGYDNWKYTVLNHFDDYADGATDVSSASFIDMAVAQSSTGRIFVVVDAQPANCGYLQCKKGTGYAYIDGENRMLLTKGDNTDLDSFLYYIGDYKDGYAPILSRSDGTETGYSVDTEFDLYKDGAAVLTQQKGTDETVYVNQNVFYADSPFRCFMTTFLWMRYSDNNGDSWSEPVILTKEVKKDSEFFLGICPGRGFVTKLADGTERIIFTVYDNGVLGINTFENVSTIYSDDNGETWHRGAETGCGLQVGKTSESQIVELNDGVLRMFARNNGNHIAYADSTDGGISWTDFISDLSLSAHGNCMCSFIDTEIANKKAVIGSFASNNSYRADGVIKVGFVESNNSINWVSTYELPGQTYGAVKNFFAYSCITELSDGNYAILYEDNASHLSYLIFSVDENGNIKEVNDNDPEPNTERNKLTFWQKLVNFFKNLFARLFNF